MIPVATQSSAIDHLPGDETAFTIGNMDWVMGALADLYSNKEVAVVRELSTNARDSHIEAGKADVPIQVTLPTILSPYFVVQDFGIGMSADTLRSIYTSFGDSTKRQSNAFNGILGFGSKAPIAYADTFTVTAIKDGIKTEAIIARKPDSAPVLKIVMSAKTDEGNGVKITVPVYNHNEFAQKARDFYRFWLPGTILVDGSEPEWAVGEKIEDNLFYSPREGTSYVVMGNVPYRIANPDALFANRGMRKFSFVAYIENGAVEFTPSREDLKYTDYTKKALHDIIANVERKVVAQAKAEIDSQATMFDAYAKWSFWTNKLGKTPFGELEFQGSKFEDTIKVDALRYYAPSPRFNTYRVESWNVEAMDNTIIITGIKTPTAHHKAKAKAYAEVTGLRASYFLLARDEKVESPWVDPKRIVSWDDVKKATKTFSTRTASGRIPGSFDFWEFDGTHTWFRKGKTLPENTKTYWVFSEENRERSLDKVIKKFGEKCVVVVLGENRVPKFNRENPTVENFLSAKKKEVNFDGESILDSEAKMFLSIGPRTKEWLEVLDAAKLDDPEWLAAANAIKVGTENKSLIKYQEQYNLATLLGFRYSFKTHRATASDALVERYPLLDQMRYGFRRAATNHLVIYMNAAYAAAQKGTI